MTATIEPSPPINPKDVPAANGSNILEAGQMGLGTLAATDDTQEGCAVGKSGGENIVQPVPEEKLEITWRKLRESAENHNREGNHSEASKLWLAAFERAKELAPAHQWYTLDNLSSTYLDLKQYEQAELYSALAVELAKEIELDLRSLASSLNTLSGALYYQSRFAEAEPLAVQVLRIYNKTLGRDHLDVATAANNLAMVYHAQGKYELAEMLYHRAVEIRTRILGRDHPSMVTLMDNHSSALVALQVSQRLQKSPHEREKQNKVVSALSDVLWEKITG